MYFLLKYVSKSAKNISLKKSEPHSTLQPMQKLRALSLHVSLPIIKWNIEVLQNKFFENLLLYNF